MNQKTKEVGQYIVLPAGMFLGILTVVLQSAGALPTKTPQVVVQSDPEWKAAFAVWDRNYREDRQENMRILMKMQESLARLEGKIEKMEK